MKQAAGFCEDPARRFMRGVFVKSRFTTHGAGSNVRAFLERMRAQNFGLGVANQFLDAVQDLALLSVERGVHLLTERRQDLVLWGSQQFEQVPGSRGAPPGGRGAPDPEVALHPIVRVKRPASG